MKGTLTIAALCLASTAHADVVPPPDTFVAAAAAAGPAESIEAACAGEDVTCKKKKLKKVKAIAPYRALGLVERRESNTRTELLGIQTDAGWYLFPLLAWGTDYAGKGSLAISSVKIKDAVPGGAPEV